MKRIAKTLGQEAPPAPPAPKRLYEQAAKLAASRKEARDAAQAAVNEREAELKRAQAALKEAESQLEMAEKVMQDCAMALRDTLPRPSQSDDDKDGKANSNNVKTVNVADAIARVQTQILKGATDFAPDKIDDMYQQYKETVKDGSGVMARGVWLISCFSARINAVAQEELSNADIADGDLPRKKHKQ